MLRQGFGRPSGRAADESDVGERRVGVVHDVVLLHQPDLRLGRQHIHVEVGHLWGVARHGVLVGGVVITGEEEIQQRVAHPLEEGHVVVEGKHDDGGHGWRNGNSLSDRVEAGPQESEGHGQSVGNHAEHAHEGQVVDDDQVRTDIFDHAEERVVSQQLVRQMSHRVKEKHPVVELALEVVIPQTSHADLLHVANC